MASFHGLRQRGDRPAGTGRLVRPLAAFGAPVAFAGLAAAFVLASQLAGSGGPRATPELPSFLAKALGAPQESAPLVRQTAPGVEVSVDRLGIQILREKSALSLASDDGGRGRWRRYENGVSRATPFGRETITVEPGKAEHYLTVERRQGVRTWRWSIDAGKLAPRITPNGAVDFLERGKVAGFRIRPVAIYDVDGRDVTPGGLRWALRRDGSAWSLQLGLDDAKLPLPYVIDPATISLRERSSAGNGAGATSLVITKPTGVVANDFMIAQITVRGGTGVAVTAPDATWNLLNSTDNGTGVQQDVYYKVAGGSEPASYTWTIAPSQRASGGIIAYYGIDNSSPIDASSVNSGTSATTLTATGITTTAANHRVVGFFGIAKNANTTAPGGMTEQYDAGSSSTQSEGADYTAAQGATGDKTATVPNAGGSQAWVAHLVALKLDVTNPTFSVSVSESPASADQHATGSTLYYRPAGLGGGFTVDSGAADAQSGLDKVSFPGLASGFLPLTALDVTTSPYSRAYTWTTGASLSGAQTLTAVDRATNSNTGTFTVTPDSSAPTTTDDTGTIGSSWKNTNQTVTLSPSDGGSGVATTYYTTDGSNPTTSSAQGTSISLTSDGTYTIKYFSVDRVSNSESIQTAGTQIRIDKTAPTAATLDALPSAIRNGQALTGSATDGGPSGIASLSYYYCAGPPCTPATLIGSSSSGPSYSVTWNSQPADGDYQVLARASDNAGNTLDSTKRTVTIDNTKPNTTIDTSPSDPSNSAAPSFTFSSNETGATFECELDSGGFTSCTSPKSYSGLSGGSHTFRVRATDAAGNVDATPASYTWTIDLTEPNTTIDSNPANPTSSTGASFTFSSNEGSVTFQCELDSGGFASCTSPKSYSSLSDGSHTFRVRATDAAGNTDATPATYTWTVDTLNPTSTIAFPASGGSYNGAGWNAGCATVGFCGTADGTGTALQTVEISIRQGTGNYWNGTGFSSATEVWNLASLAGSNWSYAFATGDFPANGNFTIRVRAADAGGNTQSPSSRTFAYDTAAPSSTTSFPASGESHTTAEWNAGCATIGFCGTHSDATSGVQKVEISIRRGSGNYWDGGSFGSASEVWNTTTLAGGDWEYAFAAGSLPADGSYTIRVKATDNGGNVEAPASLSFTYDSAAPSSTTVFPASAGIYRTSTWNAGCATSGFCGTYSDATSGVQTVEISIRRGSGNYWEGASFGSASEVWNAASLSAGDWSYVFAGATFPADGSYTIRVRATDAAGNIEAPATRSFTYDATNPSALFTFPADGGNYSASDWNAGCATSGLCGSHSDATAGVQQLDISIKRVSTNLYWNGTSFANVGETYFAATPSGSNWSYAFAASNFPAGGDYVVHVQATDNAGNVEAGPTRTFSFDTTPPDTTIDSAPSSPTTATTAGFDFSSSEGGSTFECELDSGGFSACTSPKSYSSLADGSHTFRVRARDAAGNTDPSPASHTWVVDTTAPSSTTTFPAASGSYNTSGWNAGCATSGFCGTYSDGAGSGVQKVELSIRRGSGNYWDGSGFSSGSEVWNPADLSGGNWSFAFAASSFPADGQYTVRVRATDNVSLVETPGSRTFTYDAADPSAAFTFPAVGGDYRNATWNAGCVTVGFCGSHSDATSGVQTVEISIQRLSNSQYWDGAAFASGSEVFVSANLAGSNWSFAFAATSFPADGQYAVHIRARDNAGNTESGPSRAFRIDNADPSALFTFPVAGGSYGSAGWNAGCATNGFCGTQSDGGSGVQAVEISIKRVSTDLYWDGGAFAASGETFFTAGLSGSNWSYAFAAASFPADGSYTVHIRARDNAGNTEAGPNRTFTFDATAPNTTIDSAPTSPTSSSDATFSFSSSESGSSFECELDGAGFSACTSPKSYSSLADGSHTFRVRALDGASNADPTPASHTWTVDTAAPSSTIGFPAAAGKYRSSTWNAGCATSGVCGTHSDGSGSGVQKVEVSLRRVSTGLYWNGASFSSASESFHTANVSGSDWSYAFGAANFPADGDFQVRVKATDNANNAEPASSRPFTFDATAPTGSLTAPAGGAAVRGASVTVSANSADATSGVADVSFEWRPAGGGSWTAIGLDSSSPYSVGWDTTALTDADYELRAVTSDQAGNTFQSPVVTVTVDNTSPSAATLDPLPAAIRNGQNLSGSAADATSGVATVAYYYCAGPPCTPSTLIGSSSTGPSYTFTWNAQPADGDYQVLARVTDRAGNTLDSAKQTVEIDNTDPSGSLTSPANGANVSGTVTVSSDSADNAGGSGVASGTFQYRTSPSGTWTTIGTPDGTAPYSASWNTTPLADGDYDLRVITADVAGNQFTSATRTVTADNHNPTVTISSPGAYVNAADADPFAVTATSPDTDIDNVEFFRCDNASTNCSSGNWVSLGSDTSAPYAASWPVDPDGNRALRAVATDNASNIGVDVINTTIDRAAPNTSITASPNDPSSSADASFSFSSSESGSTFECKLDGGAFASCTSPKGYTGLAAGSHTFDVRATDAAGNTDASPASHTWTIDLTAPNTNITAAPSDPSNNTDPSFSFTSSEGGSSFECKLDGGAFAPCTSPEDYTGLAAGSHTFEVRATDAAGNTDATPAAHTWTIDLAAPTTTITASPSDPSNDADPSFSFTSSESGSTFECKLDAGVFASCTSPKDYTGLASGSHTFEVRATDAAGNTDASPASHTWTIDLTAPNTNITTAPSDPSNNTDPSFSFTSSESGSSFECKLDAGAFASCTSPKGYTGLAAGSHTFEVRASDGAGNTDATPASHSWTIDLGAPQTTIDSAPADPTNSTDASFDFSSSEGGSTFECRLDGGAFASCTSPKDYTGLAAGSHTFEVRASDGAGNTEGTPASHTWTIDLTAPDTTITGSPSDPSNDVDPSFSFTASEPASSFECKLDGGSFAPCTSPKDYTGLAAGSHTFEVRATDAAANVDSSPATHTWTIDLTAPTASIDVAPTDPSGDPSPTFEFSANEPGSTFECRLDGGAWGSCSTPQTYGPLNDGNHSFAVRATDPAGNTSAAVTYDWLLDSGAPAVTLTAPSGFVNAADADPYTVTATTPDTDVTNIAFFRCDNASSNCSTGNWVLLGNDPAAPYSASWPVDADGNHALRAVATDVGTNTGVHIVNVTIDRTLPVTTIDSGPADPSPSSGASFSFSASEAGTTFSCSIDGGSFSPCSSPRSYTGLADGAHTVSVRATDAAGNVEALPPSYGWTIDTVDPNTAITVMPSDPSGSSSSTFEFTASEGGSSFRCELDGSGFSPCATPANYTGLSDGSHTFRVRAVDGAGNVDPTPASYTWFVDATAPGGGLTDPGSPLRGTVSLSASPSDSGAGVRDVEFQYSPADAGTWTTIAIDNSAPYTAGWDTAAAGDGLYDLRIVVTDNALNSSSSAAIEDRLVDNTAPSATMTDPGAILSGTVSLASTTDDGPTGSGVATVTYQRSPANAGTWTTVAQNWNTTGSPDGLYDLRVVVTDNAGNSQASAPVEDRRVDNTSPAFSSSLPVDGSTVDSAVSLTIVASEALAGMANATLDGAAPPAPVVTGNTVTYSLPFGVGPHTFAGELEDLAGNRTPILVHFTVLSASDASGMTDFPYTEKNSFASASATLATSSGLAEATVPAGGWTGAPTGDWLVIRIDPRPLVGPLSTGYSAGSDILDVTAYWAIAGTQVHDFVHPIDIRFTGAAANAVPAVLEGSTWRAIAQVPGTSLPSGDQDGFYRSGTDVHVLTRHLSEFALLRDTQTPGKPKSFRGSNTSGRLVLRWAAATDNSGMIDRYVVYANGAQLKTVGGNVLTADVGRFKTTDGRKYQVRAYDAAGNAGSLTYRLVIVPSVRNLTLADATTRLLRRGLKRGAVKRVYSATIAAGRVVSASRSGVLKIGSGIPLTVSLGSANRPAPAGSSGDFFGPGTSSGSGTGTNGGSTGSPSTSPPPAPESPPQPAPSSGAGEADGVITTKFDAPSQSDGSRLRRALGLALLSAAFILAGGALLRSRQRRYDEGAAAVSVEPVLFWDTRLLRLASRTARRVIGG
jgi:hypothetical protein